MPAPVGVDTANLLATTAFNSDFWLKSVWNQAETDTLVERVNNDLQLLWRAGQGRVSAKLWQKLDNRMKLWVDFKQQYDDAIFTRTADPNAWFHRDFDAELRATWGPWVVDLIRSFADEPAAAAAVDNYGLNEGAEQLEQRIQPPPKSDGAAWGLGLGIFVTVALIGAGVYLARR